MRCPVCRHTADHDIVLGVRWKQLTWPYMKCDECLEICGPLPVLVVLYLKAKLALTGRV